jgi:hypothetical protein
MGGETLANSAEPRRAGHEGMRSSGKTNRRVPRLANRGVMVTALQLGFLVWAGVEFVRGRPGIALGLIATFVVLHVPRLLRLPVLFDWAFLVAWSLQELGTAAGFWSRISWWDTLVHGVLPAVLAPTAYLLLVRLGVLPDLLAHEGTRARIGAVMVVFLIAAGFGTVYELYEWTSDTYLGTLYQPNNADTMTDILANDVGGLVGGLLLTLSLRGRTASARFG